MTKDRLKYLIDRYLNNTATEEELQEYANWYRHEGAEGEKLFEDIDSEEAKEYTNSLYASIINNIQFIEHEEKQARRTKRLLFIKIAAAALVVVAALPVLYNGLKTKPATPVQNNIQEVAREHIITIRNRTGISSPVYLHDGSVVQLFAGSELSYEEPFSTSHRKVYLSGKAYFKVAKDAARPFTVYSHDIATTALGTSFTITAWPGKNDVSVALHTGKVVVQQITTGTTEHMNEVYLIPGQQVICNTLTGKATMQATTQPVLEKTNKTSLGSHTGFAIDFDEQPMVNVLSAIEKGYAVTLQYNKEELADMNFSGRIKETDSLAQVLKRISILYNLSIKESGNKIIIQKTH